MSRTDAPLAAAGAAGHQAVSPSDGSPAALPPPRTALIGLTAAVGAVLLGWLIARDPEALHLSAALDATGIGILLGAVAACMVAVRAPSLGLHLLVGFVWLNLSQVMVRHHDVPSVLQVLVLPLFLAAWADGRSRTARAGTWPWSPTALLAAYTGLLLLSTTWARNPSLADARTLDVFKAGVLFVVIVLLASTRARVRVAAMVTVASGTVLAGLGVLQHVTGDFTNDHWGLARIKLAQIHDQVVEPRIAGPLGDPNFFAQILLVLVPVALALTWSSRRVGGRVAGYGAAAVLVAGTVLTYSRGGALALAVVLILALLSRGLGARRLLVGLALLSVLVLSLPRDFTRRLLTLGEILPGSDEVLDPDSSFGKRRLMVAVAWRMFLDRPLLGVGAGNYTARFPEYVEEVSSVAREYEPDGPNYPHSLYLEVLAETGLAGLALFGLALAACFAGLARARAAFGEAGLAAELALARGLEIALIGYLLSSVFLHGHHIRYLWLLLALAASLYRVSRTGGATPGQEPEKQPCAP